MKVCWVVSLLDDKARIFLFSSSTTERTFYYWSSDFEIDAISGFVGFHRYDGC